MERIRVHLEEFVGKLNEELARHPECLPGMQIIIQRPELKYSYSILKFFQVDITGVVRMTSCARYFKEGVGSSRPNWRWIMCFLERPKANTSCNACVKRLSLS